MPMSSPESKATLTEQHVIIIACVCGVIIITLLIILFCFIFRRKRNAAKHPHPQQNQGDPPPYTSVATSKTPAVYDNQDNNRMEAYSNRDAVQRSPAPDQYIELQDRGGGGDPNSSAEGGFNPHNPHGDGGRGVGGGKPKKVIYEVVV